MLTLKDLLLLIKKDTYRYAIMYLVQVGAKSDVIKIISILSKQRNVENRIE